MNRTALTAALLASLTLGGCGVNDPLEDASFPANDETSTTAAAETRVPLDAVRVAEQYARAARGFTPDTLRRNYDRQLTLSADPLHRALREIGAPSRREISALRTARARTTAIVLETTAEQVTTTAATLQLKLRERTVSTGSVQQADTANTVALEQRAGTWKVTAFTAQP